MRRQLLLTVILSLLCLASNAADRKWDFTNWSTSTIDNLAADCATNSGEGTLWCDIEKASGSSRNPTNGNCYWLLKAAASATVTVDGAAKEIPELAGLDFSGVGDRSMAMAINYASTSLGTYHGASYLWMGSKKKYFIIPSVKPGAKIEIGVESHKPTDSRGVALTAGSTAMLDQDGNSNSTPTTYVDYEWMVPSEDELTAAGETLNEDGTIDVKVSNTNGCHLYYINVYESGSSVQEDKQVAYIYNSTIWDESSDYAWAILSGAQGMVVTQIDIANGSTDVTLDSLQNGYDVVVASPYIAASDAYVSTLKKAIAYEPMLNLNPDLYRAWGYGNTLKSDVSSIAIVDSDNSLFTDDNVSTLIEDDSMAWLNDANVTGVTLNGYFANDDILATAGDAVAIHEHNAGRNTYIFLPYSKEDIANADESTISTILAAAINELAATKKTVSAVATPTITETYADGVTTLAIACTTSNSSLYYTLDGTAPTVNSTPYSEPLSVTSAVTVKAIAYADGYTESKIAELTATIKQQVATPTISVAQGDGQSTVTIGCATEGTTIYYNYRGSDTTAESQAYSEPIVVTTPVTITAFAIGDGYVNSEGTSQSVAVSGATVRYDILTSFDANRTDYSNPYDSTGKAKATYLFSWAKKARSMYDTSNPIGTETLKDQNGNDSIVTIYAEMEAETIAGNNGEWIAESQGQVVDWENNTPKFNIGDTSNYNPASATDVINANDTIGITPYFLNFGAKVSGEPYNARVRTAKAYTGPFDIVAYVGQGNGSNVPELNIEVSADAVTWDSIASVNVPDTKRLWARTKVSYEGTDAVYVRIAQVGGGTKAEIYNIYLLNAGAHTQNWLTGIKDVETSNGKTVAISQIYSLNGVRQNSLQRGINIVRYTDGSVRKVVMK